MAKMIPEFGPNESDSYGEIVLFDIIKRQLPDDFIVIHSLPWLCAAIKEISSSFAPTGEIDFLILHPKLGLLALEVKSGRYKVNRLIFTHLKLGFTKNPVNQVRRNSHGLERWLGINRDPGLRIGYGLVFPDSDFKNEIISSALLDTSVDPPQSLVIDKSQILTIGDQIISMMRYWKNTHKNPDFSDDQVNKIVNTLCPEFDGTPSWGTRVAFDSNVWLKLTHEQTRVVASAIAQNRMLITGWPGTGKTLIAIALARKLAEQGKRILFITFNSLLAKYLETQLSSDAELVKVSTWHAQCDHARKLSGRPNNKSKEWYEIECSYDLRNAIENKTLESFDALILDEAQAMCVEWCAVLQDWFYDKKIIAFADESQRFLYEKGATIEELLASFGLETPFLLTIALRTPRAVTERLLEVVPISYQLTCPRSEEEDTAQEILTNNNWQAMLDLIERFKIEGTSVADIVVLSKFRLDEDLANILNQIEIRYESVPRFRGLEAPVIIILNADELDDNQLFCAYSRATTVCVALYDATKLGWQISGRFQQVIMKNEKNKIIAKTARDATLTSNIIQKRISIEWIIETSVVKIGWCPSWFSWVVELADYGTPGSLWIDFLESAYEWPIYHWNAETKDPFYYNEALKHETVAQIALGGLDLIECKRCGASPHTSMKNDQKCVFCSNLIQRRKAIPRQEIINELKYFEQLVRENEKIKNYGDQINLMPISLAAYGAFTYTKKCGKNKAINWFIPAGNRPYRAALAFVLSRIAFNPIGAELVADKLALELYNRYADINNKMSLLDWKKIISNAFSSSYQRGLITKKSKGIYKIIDSKEQ